VVQRMRENDVVSVYTVEQKRLPLLIGLRAQVDLTTTLATEEDVKPALLSKSGQFMKSKQPESGNGSVSLTGKARVI